LQARNGVAIAKAAGAAQYAGGSLAKAEDNLARAEDYLRRKQGKTPIGTMARGATQIAEDARVLTLQKKEQERVAAEKRATEERRAKAETEAKEAAEKKLRPRLSRKKTRSAVPRRRLTARPRSKQKLMPRRPRSKQKRLVALLLPNNRSRAGS
jgi:hypothetical protein